MKGFRYLENVTTLRYDDAACTGCGMCTTVCPHGVFSMSQGKATISDGDACMECGACAKNCPAEAITVSPGVGCATAIINGWISGSKPSCAC